MLPRSVPCYKAFYQDGDGILHTMNGAATVSVGGRLTVPEEGGDLIMCRRGIHFCVTVEHCLAYYKDETWKGKRRVVAQVTPLGDQCLFKVDKYCTRGVEVVRLLEEGDMPCLATAIAAVGANPGVDNNLAVRWASKYGHVEVVRLLLTDPRVRLAPSADDKFTIR